MPRPPIERQIHFMPVSTVFKPAGIPKREIEEIVLTLDEFESVRLADWEGLYQENAASVMNISRQTFGLILAGARRKIADCILHGKALRIEGGTVRFAERRFACDSCGHEWPVPEGTMRSGPCPACGDASPRRSDHECTGGRVQDGFRRRRECRSKPE
jgi:uncharacterized protein